MANERSFPVKFALGIWHFINGSRKVFLNLLFLLFMYMLYVALMQPEETFRLKSETTLVIRPYGNVVEQYTSTPMDRALQEATGQDQSETRLRDMIEAIHRAAGDTHSASTGDTAVSERVDAAVKLQIAGNAKD